jgi:hypothetical protein
MLQHAVGNDPRVVHLDIERTETTGLRSSLAGTIDLQDATAMAVGDVPALGVRTGRNRAKAPSTRDHHPLDDDGAAALELDHRDLVRPLPHDVKRVATALHVDRAGRDLNPPQFPPPRIEMHHGGGPAQQSDEAVIPGNQSLRIGPGDFGPRQLVSLTKLQLALAKGLERNGDRVA